MESIEYYELGGLFLSIQDQIKGLVYRVGKLVLHYFRFGKTELKREIGKWW